MIYLLRHGLIVGWREKKFVGQTDIPLSSAGRRQAEFWRRRLSEVSFEESFCGDLSRARESAEIVVGKKAFKPLRELREIGLGEWDGLPAAEVRARFPRQWHERGKNIKDFRPPAGESFLDLYRRVIPCFKKIIKNRKSNILIVGHAGVNRIILSFALGLSIDRIFSMAQDYGALNIVDPECQSAPVKALNITPAFALD